MKKILITASTFPRWEGDTEPRFVLDFAKAISSEFDVLVLTPWAQGAQEKEIIEGIQVVRYHYFPLKKREDLCSPGSIMGRIKEKKTRILLVPFLILAFIFNLCKYLREMDFVVSHWIIPQGIVQSLFNKPYMIICHGSDVRSMNNGILKRLKEYALKKAKAITAVSSELGEQVEEMFEVESVLVQPMGVNVSKFEQKKEAHNQKGTVLFVGRLDKIKGVSYLIDAMEYIDGNLLIVGDGILRIELEKQAEKFGNKIKFTGAIEHDKLPSIYASADVFVAPSITMENGATEGFGLVFIEAMAAGIPVLGTATGGIRDIIDEGINGFFIEEKSSKSIAEKVNYLFAHPEVYDSLVKGAKEKVKKYDWTNVGNDYIQIINKAIKGEKREESSR